MVNLTGKPPKAHKDGEAKGTGVGEATTVVHDLRKMALLTAEHILGGAQPPRKDADIKETTITTNIAGTQLQLSEMWNAFASGTKSAGDMTTFLSNIPSSQNMPLFTLFSGFGKQPENQNIGTFLAVSCPALILGSDDNKAELFFTALETGAQRKDKAYLDSVKGAVSELLSEGNREKLSPAKRLRVEGLAAALGMETEEISNALGAQDSGRITVATVVTALDVASDVLAGTADFEKTLAEQVPGDAALAAAADSAHLEGEGQERPPDLDDGTDWSDLNLQTGDSGAVELPQADAPAHGAAAVDVPLADADARGSIPAVVREGGEVDTDENRTDAVVAGGAAEDEAEVDDDAQTSQFQAARPIVPPPPIHMPARRSHLQDGDVPSLVVPTATSERTITDDVPPAHVPSADSAFDGNTIRGAHAAFEAALTTLTGKMDRRPDKGEIASIVRYAKTQLSPDASETSVIEKVLGLLDSCDDKNDFLKLVAASKGVGGVFPVPLARVTALPPPAPARKAVPPSPAPKVVAPIVTSVPARAVASPALTEQLAAEAKLHKLGVRGGDLKGVYDFLKAEQALDLIDECLETRLGKKKASFAALGLVLNARAILSSPGQSESEQANACSNIGIALKGKKLGQKAMQIATDVLSEVTHSDSQFADAVKAQAAQAQTEAFEKPTIGQRIRAKWNARKARRAAAKEAAAASARQAVSSQPQVTGSAATELADGASLGITPAGSAVLATSASETNTLNERHGSANGNTTGSAIGTIFYSTIFSVGVAASFPERTRLLAGIGLGAASLVYFVKNARSKK